MGRVNATNTKPTSSGMLLRWRQVNKTINNVKLTLLSGFITILVLRGTIGIGNLNSSSDNRNLMDETTRVLAEMHSSNDPDGQTSKAQFNPNETYTLGPKINNWNMLRKNWLKENPGFPSVIRGKERILLISGSSPDPCENPFGDHYLVKGVKNKIDYCRLHGMEIIYNMANLDTVMSGFWAKLPLIRKLILSHPEIEWFWWLDSDALFTDMVFEVPLRKYKDHNLVIHGFPDLLFEQNSWIALNTGSFLLRNCQWSLDLLDAWAPMGPKGPVRDEAGKLLTAKLKGRPDFEADDQSALIYLLLSEKKWLDKVFIENSYYLHGYWMDLVDKYEEMSDRYHPGYGDDRWPFVTHFVGCKPCQKSGDHSAEKCLKSMERAFNFADNQVLKLYGLRHGSLLNPNSKAFRDETDNPLKFVDELDIRRHIGNGSSNQKAH
ncbi:probable xyloglucan 6-xylosyltransferase 5 [Amaranthus tricolor]|uniref:probable xyloglucan 6-xylosyltransferase 5 n=1 Tax=Amaranthus tricolor TaxID=29722 RepID=UPI0025837A39|nr:probable xyloglucan 6-xylosyltransferase 5 [Amaranthus tricolor]